MASTVQIDLRHVARGLSFSLKQVQAVVELLDDGNTVPFITRYRKDQTGGLDEEQIRQVQSRLTKARQLAERKQTILRSIESQGKLTAELEKQIQSAGTLKRLEDLYLPFKPKKQTLGTAARERGLEPLAREILEAAPACQDLDARAADFVNRDRGVTSAADALLGAGHILAEQFSERADVRQRLRDVLHKTGKFVTSRVGGPDKEKDTDKEDKDTAEPGDASAPSAAESQPKSDAEKGEDQPQAAGARPAEDAQKPTPAQSQEPSSESTTEGTVPEPVEKAEMASPPPESSGPTATTPAEASAESNETPPSGEDSAAAEQPAAQAEPEPPPTGATPPAEAAAPPAPAPPPKGAREAKPKESKPKAAPKKLSNKERRRKKAEERRIKAFHDYFDFREAIRKIPPHRLLAINRGERAKVLRVKIEYDVEAMHAALDELLVPADHPHAEYLRGCARDALGRLILPALERELRRELTDRAESHAVDVFAKNLRNLLLQPPIRGRRVLAVDPGFKSGCKLAALDQFGNLLEHGVIYLVGKPERREAAKKMVVEMIGRYGLSVVAIGNGTACREVETFFSELLGEELKDQNVSYVIVNEAGASVYSTSRIGREEFPEYDASLRGAISIGRRLLDPLSELVKIDAANIGVGMYQHDVKAKHLRESLDEVVESCVNYVGVDVNTASPALLRYVSGLNQLTARRLYEYRRSYGPFKSREQLKEVAGFGDATFVQAAGFLKIAGGANPLDATWIHPESYSTATAVLARLDCRLDGTAGGQLPAGLAEKTAGVDAEAMAGELNVGVLTLKDILANLVRPGRDPREDLPEPVFKKGVLKLEDLSPGMELTGTVLNVVDFGCFVDIGMHDSGLVHVSRLADRFVRDPHEVVAVGDVVKVWVLEVDQQRRRVSLSMVQPGTERPRRGRRGEGDKSKKTEGPPRDGAREAGQRGGARGGGEGRGKRPSDSRRSKRQRREGGAQRRGGRERIRYQPKPSRRPTPPITEEMKEGKEPMRTFGDLMQFFEQKQGTEEKDRPKREKRRKGKPKKNPTEEMPAEAAGADAAPAEADPPAKEQPAEEPPVEKPPTEPAAAEPPPGAPVSEEPQAAAADNKQSEPPSPDDAPPPTGEKAERPENP